MRIAIYHNQPSGGARRALHGFVRELSRSHEVDVFTLSTSDRGLLDEPATVHDFTPRAPVRMGLYVNDIRQRRNLRDLESVNSSLAREIDSAGYDVALVDVCRFTGAPFVLRYLRTPAAYYCHEPPRALHEDAWRPHRTAYERLRSAWRAPLERNFARRLVAEDRSLVRSADAVFTNSRYTQSRIKRIYGVEALVCSPGVDLPPVEVAARSGHGRPVLSVGALEPHKGFHFLVDALGSMSPSNRPALQLISNDQNAAYRSALERRARDHGVELYIRMRVSDEELTSAYRGASAFVYAAHDEPLGLAPLEAMAHGLAVLAVSGGGIAETVVDGETGILVPRDVQAYARALKGLLAADERRRELGARGRAHVAEQWNWPRRASELEARLKGLAAERRAMNPLTNEC
jgi:glycosyltransferase involved in cell wall biosynthesis